MTFRVTPNRRYVDRFPAEILDRLNQIWERLAYFNEDQTGLLGPTGEPVELGASFNDLATADTGDFVALGVESDGAGSSDGILRDSAGVPLDALSAVVAHRTGNLADLLALDGHAGEISVATDQDALVTHTGVIGGAKAYYREPMRLLVAGGLGANAVVPATITALTRSAAYQYDPRGITDTTGIINLAGMAGVTNPVFSVTGNAIWSDISDAVGSTRTIFVEWEVSPGVWVQTQEWVLQSVPSRNTNQVIFQAGFGWNSPSLMVGERMRFSCKHGHSGNLNLQLYVEVKANW